MISLHHFQQMLIRFLEKERSMEYDTIAELNYHLDHEIAQTLGITLDEVDAMPLLEVEKLRRRMTND